MSWDPAEIAAWALVALLATLGIFALATIMVRFLIGTNEILTKLDTIIEIMDKERSAEETAEER